VKKIAAIVICLVLALSLVACSDKNLTFDIGVASRVHIKSGLTGDEVNITDSELIKSITADINSLTFIKTSSSEGEVGYAYMLTWFDAADKQIAQITITEENGYQISYEGNYYKVGADLNINIELFDKMLK